MWAIEGLAGESDAFTFQPWGWFSVATGSRFAGFEGETRQILSSVAPDSWKTKRNDLSPAGVVGDIVSSLGPRPSIQGARVCSGASPPPHIEKVISTRTATSEASTTEKNSRRFS